ncbi:hypothetical protein NLJ89_g10501 [Agrocybe chaxingu]|uniref:Uncharacterized protein n=1 Tax=Agrocybe chaxingu TaxID=84603 RepID=A0A9W8JR17_9AGAR|nr:hypothetical protein NLJ89_g10501 [Agrocybe chaxingu]
MHERLPNSCAFVVSLLQLSSPFCDAPLPISPIMVNVHEDVVHDSSLPTTTFDFLAILNRSSMSPGLKFRKLVSAWCL